MLVMSCSAVIASHLTLYELALSRILLNLSQLQFDGGQPEQAIENIQRSLAIESQLAEEDPHSLESQISRAKAHAALRMGPIIHEDRDMAKEELLQFDGLVTEILPDARYRIQLDAGHVIVAYTAGRMKKNRIKTLAGDRVTIEMSPYDLEKGRLIFRHKDERAGTGGRPAQRKQFYRR